jgi:hypothetical protein
LSGCIDRGRVLSQETFEKVQVYVDEVRCVNATLDSSAARCDERRAQFHVLRDRFKHQEDPVCQHFAKVMESFEPGLFAGGDEVDLPRDNLDLERWFRQPKGHERRIHGRRHAGVRIVQEGPTLVLALDAHQQHPQPFNEVELQPYRHASAPACQRAAVHRRKIMRKARSKKKRRLLLAELEAKYLDSS